MAGKRAVLTWDDVAEAIKLLPKPQQDIATEIMERERVGTGQDVVTSDGPWYVARVDVAGHVGIGETPVSVRLTPAAGLTVVTARNGTGKTSLVDGMRFALSNGRARQFEIVDKNLHSSNRSITVGLTNGHRDVEIVCDNDSIRWTEAGVAAEAIPGNWVNAFERYLPVLLHPELLPVMTKPGDLHKFLKEALELGVLERLLTALDAMRRHGSDAQKSLEVPRRRAVEAAGRVGDEELAEQVRRSGTAPSAEVTARLRSLAVGLPEEMRKPSAMVPMWTVNSDAVERLVARLRDLDEAKTRVVSGADRVHELLDGLLRADGDYIVGLRMSDTCPVCHTAGAEWVGQARAEADSLRGLLAGVTAAKRAVVQALKQLSTCLPPVLTPATDGELRRLADDTTGDRIMQWRTLTGDAERLTVDTVTEATVRDLVRVSTDLATWYDRAASQIQKERVDAIAGHASARTDVLAWLEAVDGARHALERGAAADGLSNRVTEWIKETREIVFEPIGEQIVRIWSDLNADADLEIEDIDLGGGVRQAQKVSFKLLVDGTAVEKGSSKAAILSTGQRNALSLAAYLPRATQASSPFGFLILDDPIHAFDAERVRYLANELVELAKKYQVIVFTHDDRLWHALRASGHQPRHVRMRRISGQRSRVEVEDAEWPGELLLAEVDKVLRGEKWKALGDPAARAVMTFAACRQAVDTAITTQMQILGRKIGKTDGEIDDDIERARGTRDLLNRLNAYATAAGLSAIDPQPFEATITAINKGSHGNATSSPEACRRCVDRSGELLRRVYQVG